MFCPHLDTSYESENQGNCLPATSVSQSESGVLPLLLPSRHVSRKSRRVTATADRVPVMPSPSHTPLIWRKDTNRVMRANMRGSTREKELRREAAGGGERSQALAIKRRPSPSSATSGHSASHESLGETDAAPLLLIRQLVPAINDIHGLLTE